MSAPPSSKMTSPQLPTFCSSRTQTPTNLPPACVQIVPHDPSCILIGTYLLTDTATTLEAKKTGSIDRYKLHSNGSLTLEQSIPTPAILDLKFSPHDSTIFGIATSLGRITLYQILSEEGNEIKATPVKMLQVAESEDLVLSFNFSPTNPNSLAFTLTTGEVGVVSDISASTLEPELWAAHTLEAWTCEYTRDGKQLYSGGDDSVITMRDLTMGGTEVWRDRKTHGAGVTAVVSSGEMESRGGFITGSYDEVLRVWDGRMRRKMVVEEIACGGGVWRITGAGRGRWIVSGMQAGPRVVKMGEAEEVEGLQIGRMEVVAEWEKMNLNYGCDVHPDRLDRVVWCSFYDKILSVDDINV